MKIILASASPRRHELLQKVVKKFDIVPSTSEELCDNSNPIEYVQQLSKDKCSEVYNQYPHCIVIGCDTIVEYNGTIFGKPKSIEQAKAILHQLSGHAHNVHTGVTIMADNRVETFVSTSVVIFRHLTEQQIINYVATGSPFDKAGGYGIQDSGFVQEIVGSYDNILGLPTEELITRLSTYDID